MSVQVSFQHRKLKVPSTPQTLLYTIRDQVCEKFELNSNEYTLFRDAKQLDLTLPLRLANLVNNATIRLQKHTPPPKTKVKINAANAQSYINTFDTHTTLSDILLSANLTNGTLGIQTTFFDSSREISSFFASSIQFLFKKSNAPLTSVPITSSQRPSVPHKDVQNVPQPTSTQPIITQPVITQTSNEDHPEMTHQQFVSYMNHLKTQANPPLISQKTKLELKKAANSKIPATLLKIRFPESRSLEYSFPNGSTGEDVYIYVRTQLVNPVPFELIIPKQGKLKLTDHLLNDCDFGTRAVVQFESQSKVTLRGEQNANANANANAHSNAQTNAQKSAHTNNHNSGEPERKKKISVPKWLKLHK